VEGSSALLKMSSAVEEEGHFHCCCKKQLQGGPESLAEQGWGYLHE